MKKILILFVAVLQLAAVGCTRAEEAPSAPLPEMSFDMNDILEMLQRPAPFDNTEVIEEMKKHGKDSFRFSVEGVAVDLPMRFDEFEKKLQEKGVEAHCDVGTVPGLSCKSFQEVNINGSCYNLDFTNPDAGEKDFRECWITRIAVDRYDLSGYGYVDGDEKIYYERLVLPGGLRLGVSSYEDIEAALGKPDEDVKDGTDDTQLRFLRYVFKEEDGSTDFGKKLELIINGDNNLLYSITMKNELEK